MKNYVVIFVLLLAGFSLNAQNIGYVDTDKILEEMPEYKKAQDQLSYKSQLFQKEIKARQDLLTQRQTAFSNEKILLTAEQIQKESESLQEEREAIKELTEKRFGPTGDMFRTRRALVKPLQDKIANAIQKVANGSKKYGIIFDKSSDLIMVFTDPKFDLTERVQQQLDKKKPNKKSNNKKSKKRKKR